MILRPNTGSAGALARIEREARTTTRAPFSQDMRVLRTRLRTRASALPV